MNNMDKVFGLLLRRKRGEMKLSQAGLARRLNWPQTTVSRVAGYGYNAIPAEGLQLATPVYLDGTGRADRQRKEFRVVGEGCHP